MGCLHQTHIPCRAHCPPRLQGYDVTQHVLACFGGAGGQHACAIAAALGIRTIFVHRYSGILSAVGIGLAEVVQEAQVSTARICALCAPGQFCLSLEHPCAAA